MKIFSTILALCFTLYGGGLVIKNSPCNVAMTSHALEQNIIKSGLRIVAKINTQANAKAVGTTLAPSMMFIFTNPTHGMELLQQDPTVGLDLPLRVVIYQDSTNTTKIAYKDSSWLRSTHIENAPKLMQKIDTGMDILTNTAIQECKQ